MAAVGIRCLVNEATGRGLHKTARSKPRNSRRTNEEPAHSLSSGSNSAWASPESEPPPVAAIEDRIGLVIKLSGRKDSLSRKEYMQKISIMLQWDGKSDAALTEGGRNLDFLYILEGWSITFWSVPGKNTRLSSSTYQTVTDVLDNKSITNGVVFQILY